MVFRSTGDRVKIQNGKLYYAGRTNELIKRHGHRINLRTIEDQVFKITSIQNKCVWFKKQSKLLLFLLIKDCNQTRKAKILDKIRVKLLHSLPNECFPDFIEVIDNFPVTSNGKIDRRTLIDIYRTTNDQIFCAKNPVEVYDNLLVKYFGLSQSEFQVCEGCSFGEIGGNSILVMQFYEEFKHILDREVPNDLVTRLLENSLEDCRKYVVNLALSSLKRKKDSEQYSPEVEVGLRKLQNSFVNATRNCRFEIQVNWKYDLKACVDCSPVVYKNR